MNFFRFSKINAIIILGVGLAVASLWLIPGPERVGAMATIRFEQQVQQGQRRQAQVVVNSNVPVNALDITVTYPKDLLEVEEVGRENSAFDLVVFEPSFDTESGTVRFAQASLDPVEGEGVVGTINFKALRPGNPQFEISGQIIQHDGLGTNVFVASHSRSVGQWLWEMVVDRKL